MSCRLIHSSQLEVELETHVVHIGCRVFLGLTDSLGDVLLHLVLLGKITHLRSSFHLLRKAVNLFLFLRCWPVISVIGFGATRYRSSLGSLLCDHIQIWVLHAKALGLLNAERCGRYIDVN